jgi:phosphopantetheine--protein transferase-like protein
MSSAGIAMSSAPLDRIAGSLRTATLEQIDRALVTNVGPGEALAILSSDSLRVGMDLVSVAEVAASVRRLGCRYLYRVFTPHERACARIGSAVAPVPVLDAAGRASVEGDGGSTVYSMQSLAARFAAKEAAVKVLRPRGARPEWRKPALRPWR